MNKSRKERLSLNEREWWWTVSSSVARPSLVAYEHNRGAGQSYASAGQRQSTGAPGRATRAHTKNECKTRKKKLPAKTNGTLTAVEAQRAQPHSRRRTAQQTAMATSAPALAAAWVAESALASATAAFIAQKPEEGHEWQAVAERTHTPGPPARARARTTPLTVTATRCAVCLLGRIPEQALSPSPACGRRCRIWPDASLCSSFARSCTTPSWCR